MRVKDHTIIDPLLGAVYTIPEEFAVGSDDFERCCGNIFREIISRKIHWHIPLTDLETFFDNTLDDAAANIDDILNDEEFLLYEQHCLELRRKQRLYTEELLQKSPESLTDEEADFLRKKESMQVDFLLTGEYLESVRAWRELTGCGGADEFAWPESTLDTVEFRYSVQSLRGGLSNYEAQAGYIFCDNSYCNFEKEQTIPFLDADIFINGRHCRYEGLNWEDIALMLNKSGRYKLFKTADDPVDGAMHELDFFVCSTLKNGCLEWHLERALDFDSNCNEEDQKLRYTFDYRDFCESLLQLAADILASDRLYNAAWYDLMRDFHWTYTGISRIDDDDDIVFDEYCQDRWYILQIYNVLSAMKEQGSWTPETFPEIPPWCGGVPPRSTEHGFCEIIAEKTSAKPLYHTQPPRWLVGEEVFYPLEDNVENDFPEIPEGFAETVEIIKQAIDARQLVEMEYFSHKQEKTVRLFAPEIIVIYKMQWYVAGFCKLREERRTFRLDSIEKITAVSQTEPSHGIAGDVKENGLFNDL